MAALCLFANGKPCEAEVHEESCGCTVEVTTQKPKLRIEIRDYEDPNRQKYPSYPSYPSSYPNYPPSYPSYSKYPSVPAYPAEYPIRTGLSIPKQRYVPIYHDIERTRNYRPLDLIDSEMEKDYYVVPIGSRRKMVKVPTI